MSALKKISTPPTDSGKKVRSTRKAKNKKVDPADLAIENTNEGFRLSAEGDPIILPNGKPLVHPREKLVNHIIEEFSGLGNLTIDELGRVVKPDVISSYALLGVQKMLEVTPKHPFLKEYKKWLLLDPCLSRCAGPEAVDQIARWSPLSEFYQKNGLKAPDFPQIPIDLEEEDDFESVLKKRNGDDIDFETGDEAIDLRIAKLNKSFDRKVRLFGKRINGIFKKLGHEEQAVLLFLFNGHGVVLFPLLLVMGQCTAQEYANGVMAAHCLLTTAFGDVTNKAHAAIARNYREDARICVEFLENARCPWSTEILAGENEKREFKSTLRFDLKTKLNNPELEHSVLKNVTAFLNCEGGTIFVGVDDNGGIIGIELDNLENRDKWSLHFIGRIAQQIGVRFTPLCLIEFDDLHGKDVCRITVKASPEPAYLNERPLKANGAPAAFFIRGGPSARKLDSEEATKFIANRFPQLAKNTNCES
ncbi:MAG: ATP-binding protein [Verrucomicrobiota bacterium]